MSDQGFELGSYFMLRLYYVMFRYGTSAMLRYDSSQLRYVCVMLKLSYVNVRLCLRYVTLR